MWSPVLSNALSPFSEATGEPTVQEVPCEAVRRDLLSAHSMLERLYVLSSCRNPQTGRYEHAELFGRSGEQDTNSALRAWHQKVLTDWLSLTLEQQFADSRMFLAGLGQPDIRARVWSGP